MSLAQHANDREVWLNLRDRFPHPYTVADAEQYIASLAAQPVQTSFGIILEGEAAGSVGLILGDDIERGSAEIGYWLGRRYWGRGIMSEVVAAVTSYAFTNLGLIRIFAVPFTTNTASVRVLEKAGYVCEGRMHRSAIKAGVVLDQFLYAQTRSTDHPLLASTAGPEIKFSMPEADTSRYSKMDPRALTFRELLDYTAAETTRWEAWLRTHPDALDIPFASGGTATVRGVVQHIVAVERRYADRLLDEPVTPYEAVPTESIGTLFDAARVARASLERYLERATDADMARIFTMQTRSAGTYQASARKVVAHALLHGVRTWAQLATVVRQHGEETDWFHDLLFSDALS